METSTFHTTEKNRWKSQIWPYISICICIHIHISPEKIYVPYVTIVNQYHPSHRPCAGHRILPGLLQPFAGRTDLWLQQIHRGALGAGACAGALQQVVGQGRWDDFDLHGFSLGIFLGGTRWNHVASIYLHTYLYIYTRRRWHGTLRPI